MKALLSKDSPKYLRRLARKLNAQDANGAYYDTGSARNRVLRARFSQGRLEVVPLGNRGFRALPAECRFFDGYGREIVVGRHP